MSRIKLVLLSAVAVLVVSALASASASAAPHWLVCKKVAAGTGKFAEGECKTLGGTGEWEATKMTAILEIEGTSGVSKLKTEIGSTAVTIVCNKDKVAGTVEDPGNSEATITYEECSIENASTCKVANIKAEVLDRLIEKGGVIEDEFFEKAGAGFTTVVITGCTLNGSFKVTGTQVCSLPEGEVFKKLHELNCLTSGSTLKFGTKVATYEGKASIKLTDSLAFRVSK
jgi:hypothetical protein